MAVDYMEVMNFVGAMMAGHPQTAALGMQTYSSYNSRQKDFAEVQAKYQKAVADAQAQGRQLGPLDQVGIFMQLAAQYPWVIPMVTQTLAAWQSRITDAIQVLNEFQAASVAAVKT